MVVMGLLLIFTFKLRNLVSGCGLTVYLARHSAKPFSFIELWPIYKIFKTSWLHLVCDFPYGLEMNKLTALYSALLDELDLQSMSYIRWFSNVFSVLTQSCCKGINCQFPCIDGMSCKWWTNVALGELLTEEDQVWWMASADGTLVIQQHTFAGATGY